jgi:hypothetical protein
MIRAFNAGNAAEKVLLLFALTICVAEVGIVYTETEKTFAAYVAVTDSYDA